VPKDSSDGAPYLYDGGVEGLRMVKAVMNSQSGEVIEFAKTKGAATWM
jgi:hypothetical protein